MDRYNIYKDGYNRYNGYMDRYSTYNRYDRYDDLLPLHSTCCSSSTHQDDCLLKVWYCTSKWKFGVSGLFTPPESSAGVQEGLTFSFIYLAHPRSVTGFSWRKTSKYMPRYGTTLNPLS